VRFLILYALETDGYQNVTWKMKKIMMLSFFGCHSSSWKKCSSPSLRLHREGRPAIRWLADGVSRHRHAFTRMHWRQYRSHIDSPGHCFARPALSASQRGWKKQL